MNKVIPTSVKKLSLLLAIPMLFSAGIAHSASNTLVHILNAGMYGNGTMFINTDVAMAEPGCSGTRIEIPASNPAAKVFYAEALVARADGSQVRIITTGCTGGVSGNFDPAIYGGNFPTIDATTNGRVALQNAP